MVCSDDDRGRSRRPGAEDQGGHTGRTLGDQAIERSGGTICGLHHICGDEERILFGCASKLRSTVYQWFTLKIIEMIC
jgi:hypothetical protein